MKTEEIIKKCHGISKNPIEYLINQKQLKEYKYMGYSCVFLPEELVHAMGFIPIRIFGFEKSLTHSDRYIPSNCCEFAKSFIGSLFTDIGQLCEGIIFGHCCDTMQVVTDITKSFYNKQYYKFNIPTNFEGQGYESFIRSEIEKLNKELEKNNQMEITLQELNNSWGIYAENRSLVKQLYDIREKKPGIISGADSMAVVTAGFFMDKEEHNTILKQLLLGLSKREFAPTHEKRIIVSGFMNQNIELMRLIEESGCIIIDEDLCETTRYFPTAEEKEFKYPDSLIDVVISKYCPVKNYKSLEYSEILKEKYHKGADGIIFTLFSFCDPQCVEYAIVKQELNKENLKSLMIEVVVGDNNFAQIQTRIEAFLESLI